eukprot:538768_1
MSGRLPVHVGINSCDTVNDVKFGMPQNMTGIGSKMQNAGFNTYYVGKWDIGMATFEHLPKKRGFDESFVYFERDIDYWMHVGATCTSDSFTDLWEDDGLTNGPAIDYYDNDDYVEHIFEDHILDYLDEEQKSDDPFFMIYAPHIARAPMQLPKEYYNKYDNDEIVCGAKATAVGIYPGGPTYPNDAHEFHCRSITEGMMVLLDDIIGNIIQKLKDTKMYNNTLIVFTSDNGGGLDITVAAANNYPLKGGKATSWEGGIRTVTFVSGGWDGIPNHRRGVVEHGMVHIADWYTTFCELFGVDSFDYKAHSHGLPEVDGLNIWPLIIGEEDESP